MSKPHYPRGIPFKAPDLSAEVPPLPGKRPKANHDSPPLPEVSLERELRTRELQLRRLTMYLAAGFAFGVILIAGIGVVALVLLFRSGQVSPEAKASATPQPATVAHFATLPPVGEPEKPVEKAVEPAPQQQPPEPPPARIEEPVAKQDDPPEQKKPPLPEEAGRVGQLKPPVAPPPIKPVDGRSVEALGGLAASHFYQAYLNLGMLADAREYEIYTDDEAKRLLATVVAIVDTVDHQLTQLTEVSLDGDDKQKLEGIQKLTELLRAQSLELRAYWETPKDNAQAKKDNKAKFLKSRAESWKGIRELFDLGEE